MSRTYHYQASSDTLQPQAAKLSQSNMAAKAALAFLLLATAAAYSSKRVPIDARRSHVVAAERRRRFNAAAALIGVAAAPSTARAITWKVRAASLHSTSRGDGVEVDLIRHGA